jgi:DNA-binding transcriptional regulator GbsR (MarR family)
VISTPPLLSSGDLAERLGASKGSISETTRLLLRLGFIETVTLPKERKRYFRIKVESAYKMMEDHIQLFSQLRRLMEMGSVLLGDQNPERRKQMEEMVQLFLIFEEKLKQILHTWNEREGRKDQWKL